MAVLDRQYITGDDDRGDLRRSTVPANLLLGQQFTPTIGLNVIQVDLKLFKTGSPTGNIWAEIWSDSTDLPNAQIGVDSATVDVSTLGASPGAFVTFTWVTGPSIVANTKYWIVFNGDYAQSDTVNASWMADSDESGGGFSISARSNDGSTWAALSATFDFMFKEYYQELSSGLQSK